MRRRFGRRRRETPRAAPIDPEILSRVGASELLGEGPLEPWEAEDLPHALARCGLARREGEGEGAAAVVAVSPSCGGDAALAALVCAARQEQTPRRIVAVAPAWDARSQRRLAALAAPEGLSIEALALPEAGDAAALPAAAPPPSATPLRFLTAQLDDPAGRALHRRAAAALVGLAAKHGGAARGAGAALELVIAARRMARLRAEGAAPVLDVLRPTRETLALDEESLAEAFDRLEGHVRKRLSDRDVRDGEEGLRARRLAALRAAAELRTALPWPAGGSDPEVIDLAGVDARGALVIGALRERLGLADVGALLDGALALAPQLPFLLEDVGSPVALDEPPRLVLAAERWEAAAGEVLARCVLPVRRFESVAGALRALEETGGVRPARPAAVRAASGVAAAAALEPELVPGGAPAGEEAAAAAPSSPTADRERKEREEREGGRRRARGRGRRRRRGAAAEALRGEAGAGGEEEAAERAADAQEAAAGEAPRYEEVSLFDLDEESGEDEGEGRSRRRGRRRRRRPRRSDEVTASGERGAPDGEGAQAAEAAGGGGAPSEDEGEDDGAAGSGRSRRRGGRRRGRGESAKGGSAEPPAESAGEDEDDDDAFLALSPDAPDLDGDDASLPGYDDDEEEGEEPESELDRIRLEREKRRRARRGIAVASAPEVEEPEREERLELPRGRAAIVAHADRASIFAAVLLARDVRQVEGIWVYPQDELMTFFRSVATDLRESSPIFVVGFEPKPARDAIQAASLYRGRLAWFDHRAWAPEDRRALQEAIGEVHLHVEPGGQSPLPSVIAWCTRRSRFSDKLVDLATGRFSHHDFQRWGRLWWHRLGELAGRPGERRADLEPLLVGRPSDLAREAARVAAPPPPPELAWVAGRDFRLVHFGGLACLVGEVPAGLDLHLAMRIARERFAAPLSLARQEGDDVWVLGADDVTGRRAFDVGGMVEHLAEKFAWVEALPDADHVARFRARDLDARPDRLEEVIAEIGMGRSILEG